MFVFYDTVQQVTQKIYEILYVSFFKIAAVLINSPDAQPVRTHNLGI